MAGVSGQIVVFNVCPRAYPGRIEVRAFGGIAAILSDDFIREFAPEDILWPKRDSLTSPPLALSEWLRGHLGDVRDPMEFGAHALAFEPDGAPALAQVMADPDTLDRLPFDVLVELKLHAAYITAGLTAAIDRPMADTRPEHLRDLCRFAYLAG